jgi:hypothetical protein
LSGAIRSLLSTDSLHLTHRILHEQYGVKSETEVRPMSNSAKRSTLFFALIALLFFAAEGIAEMKSITGRPVIDSPQLLEWPYDLGIVKPNLNDSTSNTLHDLHGEVSSCELLLSSEGNYHPALRDIWPIFLAKFKDRPLPNPFYTTSPPVAAPQLENQVVQFGNVYVKCRPQVVVATEKVIKQLEDSGRIEGSPKALYKDRGSVILVKKGNPQNILTVWDLGRADIRFVSPNPTFEPGAFGNYAGTIYGIAENDPNPPKDMTSQRLIDNIFNSEDRDKFKWLAGPRIHHRDVPWSVAYGKADAGLILYHLGLYIVQTFPDKFDIVPLGGTVSAPEPLKGTITSTRFVAGVKGVWTPRQIEARDVLIKTLLSDEFTGILEKRGMLRPDGFTTATKSVIPMETGIHPKN